MFALCCFLQGFWVYAYNDHSCDSAKPTVIKDEEYLTNHTVYGYVQPDIFVTKESCSERSQSIEICIQSLESQTNGCHKITMKPGQKNTISAISKNLLLAQNDITKDIVLSADIVSSRLCVSMPTSRGPMPLVCKLIDKQAVEPAVVDDTSSSCTPMTPICFNPDYSVSKSPFSFSGPAYQCLSETLYNIMFGKTRCVNSDNGTTEIRPFVTFQKT